MRLTQFNMKKGEFKMKITKLIEVIFLIKRTDLILMLNKRRLMA